MNIPIILTCIVILFNLALGLVVYSRDTQKPQNKSFFLLALMSALWTPLNFFGGKIEHQSLSLLFVHGDFIMGIFLAGAFWYFGRIAWEGVCKVRLSKLRLMANAAILLLSAAATLLPEVVTVSVQAGQIAIVEGPLYWLYVLPVLFYPSMGTAYLLRARIRAKGKPKTQLNIILASLVLAAVIVITPNLLLPLVSEDARLISNFQTAAYLGFLIFLGSSTYTIIRHRLFNIRLLIARSVAYALIIATLGLLYSIAIFGFSELVLQDQVTGTSQNVIFVGLALVSAFTFQPIKRFFDKLTDRVFFQGHYDTQQVINTFSSLLVMETNIDILLRQSLLTLTQVIQASFSIIEVTDVRKVYKRHSIGNIPADMLNRDIAALLRKTPIVVTDEVTDIRKKEQLEQHAIALMVPLTTKNKHIGHLVFGAKQDGGIYSTQDIHLLEIAAKELAIALENARAFEEIEQFNITLQERIEEATRELRVKNRKLHELDKAKDEFVSMASHQLRTPLTTVKGYLSMMLDGDTGKISAAQRKVLDSAYFGAERMVSLISDMLNVSRISTGKFVIEPVKVNLLDIVKSEVAQLQRVADGHGVKLTARLPKTFPAVMLDESKTRQVMMNLIDNALYYTPAGGIVEVQLEVKSNAIEFRVVDSGIGVSEAEKARLFTKFFRAENARQQRPDGTGLGLFMAKKVITAQGGSLIFESRFGRGSTFGFRFALSLITP